MKDVRIVPEGDLALLVEFENEISKECNARVTALNQRIKEEKLKGIVETIPTFRSLLIYYDPLQTSYRKLSARLKRLTRQTKEAVQGDKRIIQIPVCYGGAYGEDMQDVCAHTGLSQEEVVKLHTGTDYLIYMLGFLPGFPYLGGLNERLATPRLKDPRKAIPAGAVGIGGEQTGIYPISSPGGWRLIGQTPIPLFDSRRKPPILYQAGDYIRFRAIDEEEYKQITDQLATGEFDYQTLYPQV